MTSGKPGKPGKTGRKPHVTPEQVNSVLSLHRDHEIGSGLIAARTGLPQSVVEYWIVRSRAAVEVPGARRGFRPAPYTRNGRPVRPFTADDDARLLAMVRSGMRPTDAARALGRRPSSVFRRIDLLACLAGDPVPETPDEGDPA